MSDATHGAGSTGRPSVPIRGRWSCSVADLGPLPAGRRCRSSIAVVLVGAVLAAVHHAEVVAHRVGEPFGSLVLAVAVTVIEVALIVTLMVSGGKDTSTLARDTVFAAVMITHQRHRRARAAWSARSSTTSRSSTPRAPARRWPPWSRWPA